MVRTVLITGCSDGGLGAALATAFHQQGERVFATARNASKMAGLSAQGIETLTLDVLSDESIQACVAKVSSLTGGKLDVLVNNAGAGYSMPLVEADVAEVKKLFDLNVFSVLRTTQLFFPLLRAAGPGALVANNTSVASVLGLPWQAPYSASKAATASFTAALRLELQPFGINVVDLKTGAVQSKFFANTTMRTEPVLPPDSVYGAIREKIEAYIHGDMGIESMDADQWARAVVKALSRRNPPSMIWRGANAMQVWLSTLLPANSLDFMVKKMTGLDVFQRKLKEESRKTK